MSAAFGALLPEIRTPPPGPRSRDLARRLARVESRNITRIADDGPVFWTGAAGANVRDADGNVYIDLTAGFGVAAAGHANPTVADAAARQLARLPHAMGDVHPAAIKVELLERLAALAPGDLSVSILSANGSDAVESALKTAAIATGRPGVVAFEGGYHGLGYGALAVTADARFRAPFARQLYGGVRFAPFPREHEAGALERSLGAVRRHVQDARSGPDPVGAVVVEPIQGRGGILVPPAAFLPGLRDLCDELELVLIADEVYTGFGRTGRWFACQHTGGVPDLLVVGKSLAGGLPLSAVIGRPSVMAAWPASEGEAIHTSTFLGNPVTAAAALAHLGEIERLGLVERAAGLETVVAERVASWRAEGSPVGAVRGRGLMLAIPLEAEGLGVRVMARALAAGVLVLPEGDAIALTPPLVITEAQLEHALAVLRTAIDAG